MNIAKFLRTPILKDSCEWLHLGARIVIFFQHQLENDESYRKFFNYSFHYDFSMYLMNLLFETFELILGSVKV